MDQKAMVLLAFALAFALRLLWRLLGALLAIRCWGGGWRWQGGVQDDLGACVCIIREVWVLTSLRIPVLQKPCINLQAGHIYHDLFFMLPLMMSIGRQRSAVWKTQLLKPRVVRAVIAELVWMSSFNVTSKTCIWPSALLLQRKQCISFDTLI